MRIRISAFLACAAVAIYGATVGYAQQGYGRPAASPAAYGPGGYPVAHPGANGGYFPGHSPYAPAGLPPQMGQPSMQQAGYPLGYPGGASVANLAMQPGAAIGGGVSTGADLNSSANDGGNQQGAPAADINVNAAIDGTVISEGEVVTGEAGWYDAFAGDVGLPGSGVRYFDASIDAMFMFRTVGGAGRVLTTRNGAVETSTDEFEGLFAAAPRITGRIPVTGSSFIEGSWFGTQFSYAETVSSGAVASLNSPFFTINGIGTNNGNLTSLQYGSQLDSVELSWRTAYVSDGGRWTWTTLCGIRYIQLDEDLTYLDRLGQPGTASNLDLSTKVETENDLLGYQMGLSVSRHLWGSWRLDGSAKAGLYGNHARRRQSIFNAGRSRSERRGETEFSYSAEGNAYLVYDFCNYFNFRVGYQAFVVGNVALAADNIEGETRAVNVGMPRHDASATSIYHSAFIGFEFTH